MRKRLGMRAVEKGLISLNDLHQARERQRMFGGRIGSNLVALDLLSEEDLATFFRFFPKEPSNVKETEIDVDFISDLILKHALFLKSFDMQDLTEKLKLNQSVMIECLDSLRHDRMIEITKGDTSLIRTNYQYRITDSGINRAMRSE